MSQESEKIESLSVQLHAAQVRISKLDASNRALASDRAALAAKIAMYECDSMRSPKKPRGK